MSSNQFLTRYWHIRKKLETASFTATAVVEVNKTITSITMFLLKLRISAVASLKFTLAKFTLEIKTK